MKITDLSREQKIRANRIHGSSENMKYRYPVTSFVNERHHIFQCVVGSSYQIRLLYLGQVMGKTLRLVKSMEYSTIPAVVATYLKISTILEPDLLSQLQRRYTFKLTASCRHSSKCIR